MMLRGSIASLVALSAALIAPAPLYAQILSANVQQGKLTGTREKQVSAFLGVPYAAPPTGESRWAPPKPAASWSGVRKAATLPLNCEQVIKPDGLGAWTREYSASGPVSEDCLYLNVWTPAKTAGAKLPVLVWIHGGGFFEGSASVPIYNGSKLAAKGIVVIGINYRLGMLGFMAHPELSAESPARASGNYGLLDQIAALKWIKANAAAFGGDPNKITIAGQSAGALSVHHLISSPLAKGLFARAIAQSGSGGGIVPVNRAAAEGFGMALMKAADVSNIAEMRKLTFEQLLAAQAKLTPGGKAGGFNPLLQPIIDGLVLPDASFVDANTNDTPLLTGMTAQELSGMNPFVGKATPDMIKQRIAREYGPLAPRFEALYPATDPVSANQAADALARDAALASLAFWAENRQRKSARPLYGYLFSHVEPGPNSERFGAFHSSEIPYVFNTLDASPERPFTDVDRKLANEMSSYWSNFVKNGNPNRPGLVTWPVYHQSDVQILEIDETTKARPILAPEKLEAFRQYVANGGRVGLFVPLLNAGPPPK